MARMPLARLHRSLQIAQIKALDIAPDHPCRMLRSKQAVQVDSSQLDLIALRLPKPRPASRRPSLRLASFREFLEQTVVRRSEEHTSELQSLMRISYAVFCLKKKRYAMRQTSEESTPQLTEAIR